MCTTNLCIGFYVLTLCLVGWFGTLALVMIKSSKEQGNSYVLDPLGCWVSSEIVNPLNCFNSEVINPLVIKLGIFRKVFVREWNNHIAAQSEIRRAF
tara:strand:+ start:147 stop:437 length:291 start_codon:yes stop_codon:yes gene_type:complete